MKRMSFLLLLIILFLPISSSLACDENMICDKCAKPSEFTWNPDNQYVTPRLKRFYALNTEIDNLFANKEFDRVKNAIPEYLELAKIYRCNWNYGNAIHDSNRMLGLISLNEGNIELATEYLLKAGKSTGSPQLDTFGPELDLANQLLKSGKTNEVVAYLKDIEKFWDGNDGKIQGWIESIEKGEQPEITRYGEISWFQYLIFWITLLWPIILTLIILAIWWNNIKKKIVFVFIGVVVGYAVMIGFNILSSYMLFDVLSRMSGLMISFVMYLDMAFRYMLPVIAVLIISRNYKVEVES
jgi:hypothetical protein